MGLIIKLAWRNLFRNTRRTILTLVLVGFSLAAMIIADGAIIGMTRLMVDNITESLQGEGVVQRAGFTETYDTDLVLHDVDALRDEVASDPSVEAAAPRIMSGAMISSSYNVSSGQVLGVDANLERRLSKIAEAVVTGDYLGGRHGEILIGKPMAELLEVGLGDRLVLTLAEAHTGELAQALFRVSGILEFGIAELDESMVFVNLEQAQDVLAMPGQAHQVVVQFVSGATLPSPSDPETNVELFGMDREDIEVMSWLQASPDIASMLSMTEFSSAIVGLILFFLASLGIVNSLFMSIYERLYEFGVIRAVGTRPRQIGLLIVTEAALIGLAGCLMGVVVGGLGSYWFSVRGIPMGEIVVSGVNISVIKTEILQRQFVDFPFYVIVLTMLAAIYPARFAARLTPAHALKRTL